MCQPQVPTFEQWLALKSKKSSERLAGSKRPKSTHDYGVKVMWFMLTVTVTITENVALTVTNINWEIRN